MNEINKINPLNPFGRMCISLGMLPSSYKESLTYEEQLLWLFNYLEKTLIPKINEDGETVNELIDLFNQLKNYVDNYFENLDVQDEINHKLDEMVEDGTFDVIFAQVDAKIGDLSALTTTDKSSIVAGVNEIKSEADTNASAIGTLSSLTTTDKTDLVSAINEVDSHADTNASAIGTLSSLTTTNKTDLVSAINEVKSDNATDFFPIDVTILANETGTTFAASVPSGFTHNSCIISSFLRESETWNQIYSDSSTATGFTLDLNVHDGYINGSIEFNQAVASDTDVTIVVVWHKFKQPF